MTDPDLEKKWLVKMGGTIEGPLSFDELVHHLVEKKISLIDEVRDPESRWCFVREHPLLTDLVQRLRNQQMNLREDTAVSGDTETISETETITDIEELTPVPEVSHRRRDQKTINAEPLSETIDKPYYEKESSFARGYVSKDDYQVQQHLAIETSRTLRWVWALLAVVIVLAATTIYVTQYKGGPINLSADQLLSLARSHKKLGLWHSSLDYYKRSDSKNELDIDTKSEMAPMLMFLENRNQETRRILEQALKKGNIGKTEELNFQIWIALSFLRDGQREQARVFLETLLKQFPNENRIHINLAVIDILSGRSVSALERINILINKNIQEPRLLVMKGLATFLHNIDSVDERQVRNAISDINGYLSRNLDLRLEALLIKASLLSLVTSETEVEKVVRELLSEDPMLTQDHIHGFNIDWSLFEWEFFLPLCQKVENTNPASAWSLGLKVFCLIQIDQKAQALKDIEFARNQYTADLDLMGLQAWLLADSSADTEARAVGYLDKKQESSLVQLVVGNLCLKERDLACAETRYKEVLEMSKRSVSALYGLAVVHYERGKNTLANDMVKRGLLISSKYRPFIELKEKISAF